MKRPRLRQSFSPHHLGPYGVRRRHQRIRPIQPEYKKSIDQLSAEAEKQALTVILKSTSQCKERIR